MSLLYLHLPTRTTSLSKAAVIFRTDIVFTPAAFIFYGVFKGYIIRQLEVDPISCRLDEEASARRVQDAFDRVVPLFLEYIEFSRLADLS